MANYRTALALVFLLAFSAGCSLAADIGGAVPQSGGLVLAPTGTNTPLSTPTETSAVVEPVVTRQTADPTQPAGTATPVAPAPTGEEVPFEVGEELTIRYLRGLEIAGSEITFEEELTSTFYYRQHLVSYVSEGNKIYGLLTVPTEDPPAGGFKAIVFNHGYIPPDAYRTTERYVAYVDYLARNGFVVFKIDLRGHGASEGEPSGTYFSPGYTIDAIAALKSLQRLDFVDPQGIGMWGHSMAGNLVLRAMLIEPDVKAGVIWSGAVYSYDDFVNYGIDDNTFRPPATPETEATPDARRRSREILDTYGRPDTRVAFWQAVSLTENIALLNNPLQIHHAVDDPVVTIGYSYDLAAVLQAAGKAYEFFEYEGGGHNINSPYFDQAMIRTVEFFRQNL
jgi:dipeptidyl aminopeptidase/acylaminoacyl peptidase